MKKIIIMSLLATLVSVFTATAQENTYSIVVKMQNGTVLTIGPNEADSIYFKEGKLNVSGQSIEDIQKQIAQLQNDITAIAKLTQDVHVRANDNSNRLGQSEKDIKTLSEISNALNADLTNVKKNVEQVMAVAYSNNERIKNLEEDNAVFKAKIEQLEAIVNELQSK